MTEEEWLTYEEPFQMLELLHPRDRRFKRFRWFRKRSRIADVSERKLRLFGVACCRRIWDSMWEGCHPGVEAAEQFAEGTAGVEALAKARLACLGDTVAIRAAASAAEWVLGGDSGPLDLTDPYQQREACQQAALLRDIFGNPFRPVARDPAWLTSDVLALACGMYESRDFGAMPILADALQDAGCDNADVLAHCRDASATHVRGCWVVDLVLGKG